MRRVVGNAGVVPLLKKAGGACSFCPLAEELLLSGLGALALFQENPGFGRRHPSGRIWVRVELEFRCTNRAGPGPGLCRRASRRAGPGSGKAVI